MLLFLLQRAIWRHLHAALSVLNLLILLAHIVRPKVYFQLEIVFHLIWLLAFIHLIVLNLLHHLKEAALKLVLRSIALALLIIFNIAVCQLFDRILVFLDLVQNPLSLFPLLQQNSSLVEGFNALHLLVDASDLSSWGLHVLQYVRLRIQYNIQWLR